MVTTTKRVAFRVLLVLVAVGGSASLALGYFYLRARADPFPRFDIRIEGDWPIERDDEIGFVAAKKARTIQRQPISRLLYHVFTDRRGARVNGPDETTPPHVDVLTIGCSFSWGYTLENENTYTEGLRRRLGVPVANMSMGSYGTVHSLLLLRRHLDLRPRVIVYGFMQDHLRRNLSPCAPSYAPFCAPVAHVGFDKGIPSIRRPKWDHFSAEQNRKFYEEITMTDRFTFRDVLWRARVDLFRISAARDIQYPQDPGVQSASLAWLVHMLAEEARGAGASLIILHIPELSPGEARSAPPALVTAARAEGTLLVDLASRVDTHHRTQPDASLVMSPTNLHPSATAHALIADELETVIRGRLGKGG